MAYWTELLSIIAPIIGFCMGIIVGMIIISLIEKVIEKKERKILIITRLSNSVILPNIAIHQDIIIYDYQPKDEKTQDKPDKQPVIKYIEDKSGKRPTRNNVKNIKPTKFELMVLNKILNSEFQERTLIENEIINNPVWSFSVTDKSNILSSALKLCTKKGYIWTDTVLGGEVCSLTNKGRKMLLQMQNHSECGRWRNKKTYLSKRDYPKFQEYD